MLLNVEEWRTTLESLSEERYPNEEEVDKTLKYLQDARQVTSNDCRLAAHAYYMSSESSERVIELYKQVLPEEMDFNDYTRLAYAHYLLDHFADAADVYDLAFSQVENPLDYKGMYDDLSDAAWANYKSGRYSRSAELWDIVLENFPQEVGGDFDIDDIVDAHEKAGNTLSANVLKARKKELYNRAKELQEAEELSEEEE